MTHRARTPAALLVLTVAAAMTAGSVRAAEHRTAPDAARPAVPPAVRSMLSDLPAGYDANEGQFDPSVRFVTHGGGVVAWLRDGEVVLVLGTDDPGTAASSPRPHPATKSVGVVRMRFGGAVSPRGTSRLEGVSNWVVGDDPTRWRSGVASFREARYEAVAPGVDLVWHGTRRALEYDLLVAPGADPSAFAMQIDGAASIAVDAASGELVVRTEQGGELRHSRPKCVQIIDGQERSPASRFVVEGARVRFEVPQYDRTRELVIDPQLDLSTYLGGSTGQETAWAIATGPTGDLYVAGTTSSFNFPVLGAYQASKNGFFGSDAFVTRLKGDGTGLSFSTYFGGGSSETADGVAVDGTGALVFCGYSNSNNIPRASAAQNNYGGGSHDGFVTKLTSNGGTLTFSTYLGGSGDDYLWGIAQDSIGGVYVAGETASSNLPATSARQAVFGGGSWDGLVGKYTATGTLSYLTYHGGSGNDGAYAITVDGSGQAVIGGYTTTTTGFPLANAFQGSSNLGQEGFLAKYNSQGRALVYGTYFGGGGTDAVYAVSLEASGAPLISGSTSSTDFPTLAGYQSSYGGGGTDAFVARFHANGSPLLYSTLLGGVNGDIAYSVQADKSGGFFVVGLTGSGNFPIVNGLQTVYGGGNADAFVVRFASTGAAPAYSTFFGGNGEDDAYGSAIDVNGNIVITGITYSSNLTTKLAYQASNAGGSGDAFVTRIAPFAPTAPQGLAAVLQAPLLAHLAWSDRSVNETGFAIERKIGTGNFTAFVSLGPDQTTYDDGTLSPSQTYSYRVRATGAEGSSAYTNEATVTTASGGVVPPPPKAPDGLVALVVSSSEIQLSWNDKSNDETRFEVQRQTGGAPFAVIASPAQDATSFIDETVPPGWPVSYRVRALSVQGPSASSSAADATTLATLILTTTKGKVLDSGKARKDKVTWTAALGPTDATVVLDPKASGLRLQAGPPGAPVTLSIPSGDAGWKFTAKTKTYKWLSPKGAAVKASVIVNALKNTVTVSLSGFDFTAQATTSVRMMLALGDVSGGLAATWVEGKTGVFAPPKPPK